MRTTRRNDYVLYDGRVCYVRDIYDDDYVLLYCVDNGAAYLAHMSEICYY